MPPDKLKSDAVIRLELTEVVHYPTTYKLKSSGVIRLPQLYYGQHRTKITATLTWDGRPLIGKIISFMYREHGTVSWIDVTTALTDAEGKAVKELYLPAPKRYDFYARFTGDETYKASECILEDVYLEPNVPYYYETYTLKTVQGLEEEGGG